MKHLQCGGVCFTAFRGADILDDSASNSKLMLALKGKAKRDGLTKKAQEALLKHGKKHSQEHMAFMRYEMMIAGKSFKEAHKSAMERYGT